MHNNFNGMYQPMMQQPQPAVLTVMNTTQTATFDNINLVAYKIC